MPRFKFLIFNLYLLFLIFNFLSFSQPARASIFDPVASIGNSIFTGIQDTINGIFNPQNPAIGGASIPQLPGAIPTAIPGVPRPDTGDFVKLTLEWTALSTGRESVSAAQNDPLEAEHLAQITCCKTGDPTKDCTVKNVKHVLWGWCGQTSTTTADLPSSLGIKAASTGPNTDTLPKSISNKYIRRDGYSFECESAPGCQIKISCSGDPCYKECRKEGHFPSECETLCGPCFEPCPTTTNYMEFQTEVYHSNDFSMYLKVQNLTNHKVENVEIDTSLPHNLDYPYQTISTSYPQQAKFAHGSSLPPFAKTENNLTIANIPPLKIGPFNLNPAETKIIPIQDETLNRSLIPSSISDPNTCSSSASMNYSTKKGAITPRDYENITTNSTNSDCKKREFLDVTGINGCGYNASSNNSVIGPMQFTATYGKNSSSRSILLASIPVGGKIIDDEARPFGWPANGTIKQSWGLTGLAQEQGARRSTIGQLYTDYLYCPNKGATYPQGRTRAGDWLHPGIDIKPAENQTKPLGVYATQAGWLTFAGTNPAYPEKGVTVQVESDVNQDNLPDFATRYEHLFPGSLTLDVQNRSNLITESARSYAFGTGAYISRNQLLGLMGDSGSPGFTNLHYEILINPQSSGAQNGQIGVSTCTDDPYQLACLTDSISSFFFSMPRFEGETVKAPVYTNP